jgi:hypothetical protein
MKTILGVLCVAMLAGGCSQDDKIAFDGQFFRTGLKKGEARHMFTVTAKPASASLAGARAAAEYEAISYCVNEYGSSDISWIVGPETADASLPIDKDTLILQGSCPQ